MSFVGDLLGLGGSNGSGFQASAVPVYHPDDIVNNSSYYGGVASGGVGQQGDFVNRLLGMNPLGYQHDVLSQQFQLSNQLQGMANGEGPNPALSQLAQTTGQNVAAQNALAAGQRGAASNVGLLARQAGMQGANIEQQATGQAATLRAQQQLAAVNALQQQQQNLAGLTTAQAQQAQQGLNAYNTAAQGEQGQLLNFLTNFNNTRVNQQNSMNATNAGVAAQNAKTQGGLLSGAAGGLGALGVSGLFGGGAGGSAGAVTGNSIGALAGAFAGGGEVGPRSKAAQFLKGMHQKPISGENLAANGMKVPGKGSVQGNSLKNDTVPAMLSPGEVVIPRSVMQSEDPVGNSAKFVQAVMAKKRG